MQKTFNLLEKYTKLDLYIISIYLNDLFQILIKKPDFFKDTDDRQLPLLSAFVTSSTTKLEDDYIEFNSEYLTNMLENDKVLEIIKNIKRRYNG